MTEWTEQWMLASSMTPLRVVATLGPLIHGEQTVEVVPKLEAEQRITDLKAEVERVRKHEQETAEVARDLARVIAALDQEGDTDA